MMRALPPGRRTLQDGATERSPRPAWKVRWAQVVTLLLWTGACSSGPAPRPPSPVAPPPPPPAAKVPPGCEVNLTGSYHLATYPGRAEAQRSWSYSVEDDGTRLVARLRAAPPDAEPMTLVLERTPVGFVGHVEGQATTRGGRRCPVHFQAEVVACSSNRIVLRSEDARSIDENCTPGGPDAPATEKTLVRD